MLIKRIFIIFLLLNPLSYCPAMEKNEEQIDANLFFIKGCIWKLIEEKPQFMIKNGETLELFMSFSDCIDKPLITKALVIENYATKEQVIKFYELTKKSFDIAQKPENHSFYSGIQNNIEIKNALAQGLESINMSCKYMIIAQIKPNALFDYKNSSLFEDITDKFNKELNEMKKILSFIWLTHNSAISIDLKL